MEYRIQLMGNTVEMAGGDIYTWDRQRRLKFQIKCVVVTCRSFCIERRRSFDDSIFRFWNKTRPGVNFIKTLTATFFIGVKMPKNISWKKNDSFLD